MWYSRSFADAQDDKKPLRMTMLCTRSFTSPGGSVYGDKSGSVQDDKSGSVQDDKSGFVQDGTTDREQARFVSY